MAPQINDKPKRHKKRKSRTEVSSDSDLDSDHTPQVTTQQPPENPPEKSKSKSNSKSSPPPTFSKTPKEKNEEEIDTAFTKFYMQRVTTEFAEDLDKLRQADDFKDDGGEALPMLIEALRQGTRMFGVEEKRRIVEAGKVKDGG